MGMMVEISRVKAEFATSYKTHFFSKAVSLNFIANLLFIGQHGYALPTRSGAEGPVKGRGKGRALPSKCQKALYGPSGLRDSPVKKLF